MDEYALMQRAIALGERGRRTSAPNPWVGCIIAREGQIVGEGYHRKAGQPHAEVVALAQAGQAAPGATAFVTLEPCAHRGRTGPCTEALLVAGVTRVVAAVLDPDEQVAGRGLAQLREAGVDVEIGLGRAEAERSLRPYLRQRQTGRPFLVAKTAMSIDGRTAAEDGSSHWITGEAARADGHQLRADSQAVIVGAGTALADAPELTVRSGIQVEQQPLRVLLDARGRVPARGPLFDTRLAPTLVITTDGAAPEAMDGWRKAGAEVVCVPPDPEERGVNLEAALCTLGQRGVLQALVEPGAEMLGSLQRARLVDQWVVYVGTCTLGERGRPVVGGPGPHSMSDASQWRLVDVAQVGLDARLVFEPAERTS